MHNTNYGVVRVYMSICLYICMCVDVFIGVGGGGGGGGGGGAAHNSLVLNSSMLFVHDVR